MRPVVLALVTIAALMVAAPPASACFYLEPPDCYGEPDAGACVGGPCPPARTLYLEAHILGVSIVLVDW